ncbi:MAG: ABC transporter permease [Pseudobutyrivibrio sp.]|nr:ABC transporter permease [Pseudobutyrivibrio sp.]
MLEFYKKEMKLLFRNKVSVIMMFIAPIALILLMSYAFSEYMGGKQELFDGGKLYYYMDDTTTDNSKIFSEVKKDISEEFNITFEEITDYDKAVASVKKQEAYGILTVKADGFDYYRSEFNETSEGQLIRQALIAKLDDVSNFDARESDVEIFILNGSRMGAKEYFSIVELTLVMMYISFIIANSLYTEYEDKTLNRVMVSKAKLSGLLGGKLLAGLTIGIIQITEVYLFTTYIFGLNWGDKTLYMFLEYGMVALFSTLVGICAGYLIRNKDLLDMIVLMSAILVAFLGGTFTPLSSLQSFSFMRTIIRISPLYWTNNSLIELYAGSVSNSFYYSVLILGLLSLILGGICILASTKKRKTIN